MFPNPMTVREIAARLGATVEGDEAVEIRAIASMQEAGAGDLTFAVDAKRAADIGSCQASAIIVPNDVEFLQHGSGKTLLRVGNVNRALADFLGFLAGPESDTVPAVGIAPSAVVDASAEIGQDAAIGPNVVIGPRTKIGQAVVLCAGVKIGPDVAVGAGCVFHEGVVVRHGCRIGKDVRIGPNSVVGSDGYGYFFAGGVHNKIPHAGNVIIEDGVELGACVCVDRAKWGSTRIGVGAKIDNLCQIAHNVQIGPGCLMAGLAGAAGSVKLGQFVVVGGHTALKDNIELGEGAIVGGGSGLTKSVPPGQTVFGYPAKEAKTFIREHAAVSKLPKLLRTVKTLEKRMKKLESATDNQEQRDS